MAMSGNPLILREKRAAAHKQHPGNALKHVAPWALSYHRSSRY